MRNPKRPQPSPLFELEQSLQKARPQPPKPNPAPPTQKLPSRSLPNQTVTAQAFDWDETIELEYRQEAFPDTSLSPSPFSEQSSFSAEPEDTAQSFEVEAFELDEDKAQSTAVDAQVKAFELEDEDEVDSVDRSISAQPPAKPVEVDVATPFSVQPLKSAHPIAHSDSAEDAEIDNSSLDVFDTEAFAADIEAILTGKTEVPVQPVEAPSVPATPSSAPAHPHDVFDQIAQGKLPPPTPTPSPAPAPPDQEEARPFAYSHAIFDQMAESMAYANSFNLGTISLEQQFDEFDRLLDQQEQQTQMKPAAVLSHASELDEAELAEDLALINGVEFAAIAMQMGETVLNQFVSPTFLKILRSDNWTVVTKGEKDFLIRQINTALKKDNLKVKSIDEKPEKISTDQEEKETSCQRWKIKASDSQHEYEITFNSKTSKLAVKRIHSSKCEFEGLIFEYTFKSTLSKGRESTIDENQFCLYSPSIKFEGEVRASGQNVEQFWVGIIQEIRYSSRIADYSNDLKMEGGVFNVAPNSIDRELPLHMRDTTDDARLPCDGHQNQLKPEQEIQVVSEDDPNFDGPISLQIGETVGDLIKTSGHDDFSTWLVIFNQEKPKKIIILGRIDWSVAYEWENSSSSSPPQAQLTIEPPDLEAEVLLQDTPGSTFPQCLKAVAQGDFVFRIYSSKETISKLINDEDIPVFSNPHEPEKENPKIETDYSEKELKAKYKEAESWWDMES